MPDQILSFDYRFHGQAITAAPRFLYGYRHGHESEVLVVYDLNDPALKKIPARAGGDSGGVSGNGVLVIG